MDEYTRLASRATSVDEYHELDNKLASLATKLKDLKKSRSKKAEIKKVQTEYEEVSKSLTEKSETIRPYLDMDDLKSQLLERKKTDQPSQEDILVENLRTRLNNLPLIYSKMADWDNLDQLKKMKTLLLKLIQSPVSQTELEPDTIEVP
jgi:hypothetical protein